MTDREIALAVAWRYLGTPYRWGGDDPSGFDCSGLIVESLQSAGRLPRSLDLSAEGLRRRFPQVAAEDAQPGDLVFWLREGRAFHVGMLIDPPTHYIGADGGGSTTKTLADAWGDNAYVKARPVATRGTPDTRRFATPVYDDTLGPEAPEDGG